MSALDTKIPPPVVTLLAGLLMWLVSRALAPMPIPPIVRTSMALVLASLGVAFAIAGVLTFRQARTTVNPTTPGAATALVRTGIYRLTRNPMYLGLLLCLTAWAIWLANVWSFLVLPAFVAYLTRFQIVPEERALSAMFGDAYADYARKVRRW